MGARLYETEEDRQRERLSFKAVQDRFNCQCHKLSLAWQVDFLGSRDGDAVCLGEVKTRNHRRGDYPTVFMSRHKLRTGVEAAQILGVPMMCFFEFKDGRYWWKAPLWVKDLSRYKEEKLSARNHADDPTDTEWVLHIPIEELRAF